MGASCLPALWHIVKRRTKVKRQRERRAKSEKVKIEIVNARRRDNQSYSIYSAMGFRLATSNKASAEQ